MKAVKVLLIPVFLLICLPFFLFKKIEQKPYKEYPFYSDMMLSIDSACNNNASSSEIMVGWSKEEIIPNTQVPIASYGLRDNLKGIHDTAFVKAFAISNKSHTAFMVTADLLIFPPAVLKSIEDSLGKEKVATIYFSATHTHNGPGGWMEGPAARFFAGSFKKEYTLKIRDAVISAINKAEKNKETAILKYGESSVPGFVKNRVVKDAKTDSLLRYLIIEKENGLKAILTTYGAHPNCISHKINLISADYPGELTDSLESGGYDMAAFFAGAVGSMGNECQDTKNFECTKLIGESLATEVLANQDSLSPLIKTSIASGLIPLKLKDPCPKIYNNWTIRPWVFETFVGKQAPFISFVKIGNILFIGTPCDYSGVLANQIYQSNESKGLNLVFTSFNGNYIGYITPDSYSQSDHSEVMEMNWYGPGSGSYFQEIIKRLIKNLNEK